MCEILAIVGCCIFVFFLLFLMYEEENNYKIIRSIKNKIFKPKIIPFENLTNEEKIFLLKKQIGEIKNKNKKLKSEIWKVDDIISKIEKQIEIEKEEMKKYSDFYESESSKDYWEDYWIAFQKVMNNKYHQMDYYKKCYTESKNKKIELEKELNYWKTFDDVQKFNYYNNKEQIYIKNCIEIDKLENQVQNLLKLEME